ncbi:MAG: class I SAM-dependent methyltransferase [Anaerolineales bacterium]|nr:class I SAM-dependent methyltransferase [Anaerolineales bacterium]
MNILPESLLKQMAASIPAAEVAEMAIPSYLHKNPALRWMAHRRLQVLSAWIKDFQKPGLRILDFGCGTGILFPAASQVADKIYGLDLQLQPARMLIEHFDLKNVVLIEPEDFAEAVQDGELDLIICGEVLEHIPELAAILNQFQRKLNAQGHLFVTAPTESALYKFGRKLAGFSGEYHVQNADTIHRAILSANFEVSRRQHIPLPAPFAIYWALDYIKNQASSGQRSDDALIR